LNWIFALLLVISLHWIFVTSRAIFGFLDIVSGDVIQLADLFSITIFFTFTTVLVFKGLYQIKFTTGLESKPKYASSGLTDFQIQKYTDDLTTIMNNDKPYLNPSLTIDNLSTQLDLNSWDLSRLINDRFGQNFFNFINGFRIVEAKRLLSDSSDGKKTVLEILYEVGFNSKSAFNTAFKKHTGMTPTDYKRKNSIPDTLSKAV